MIYMRKTLSFIAVLFLALFLVGCVQQPAQLTAPEKEKPDASKLIGLWTPVKGFDRNPDTNEWREAKISSEIFEFQEKTMCGDWKPSEPHCAQYTDYSVDGNKLSIPMMEQATQALAQAIGMPLPSISFEWSITGETLEFVGVFGGMQASKVIFSKTTPEEASAAIQEELSKLQEEISRVNESSQCMQQAFEFGDQNTLNWCYDMPGSSYCSSVSREDCLSKLVKAVPESKTHCKEFYSDDNSAIDGCFGELGGAIKDLTVCDDASDKDYCHYNYSLAAKDLNVCGKVIDANYRNECTYNIQEIKDCFEKSPEEWCYSLPDGSGCSNTYDDCLATVASMTKDPSICEDKITSQDSKDLCYWYVGSTLSDVSYCDKIIGQEPKDACYSSLGTGLSDESICAKITDSDTKGSCYTSISIGLNDPSTCSKAPNKDSCYYTFATNKCDSSACALITDSNSTIKEECISDVNAWCAQPTP